MGKNPLFLASLAALLIGKLRVCWVHSPLSLMICPGSWAIGGNAFFMLLAGACISLHVRILVKSYKFV